jgi:hypothetical protein
MILLDGGTVVGDGAPAAVVDGRVLAQVFRWPLAALARWGAANCPPSLVESWITIGPTLSFGWTADAVATNQRGWWSGTA